MFKNHDNGIITLSLFTTFTHVFFWRVIILLMCWSCEGKYTIAMCMLYVQTTVYNVHKAHLFCTYQSITDYLYVQCRLYIGNTYVAYCVYSVFAIHYKYIVVVLWKTIRRTIMIDHSFERKFHVACYRPRFTIFYRLILNIVHDNSKT